MVSSIPPEGKVKVSSPPWTWRPVAGLILAVLAVAAACGGPVVQVRQWTLEYPPPGGLGLTLTGAELRMDRFTVALAHAGNDMIYRPESFQRGVDPYNRWRVNPGDLAGGFLLRDLRGSGLFRVVYGHHQPGRARFRLEGGVDEYLELASEGNSAARLKINLTLVDTSQGDVSLRVLFQKDYAHTVSYGAPSAQALAEAMSQAMARVSAQAIRDIHQAIVKALAGDSKEP